MDVFELGNRTQILLGSNESEVLFLDLSNMTMENPTNHPRSLLIGYLIFFFMNADGSYSVPVRCTRMGVAIIARAQPGAEREGMDIISRG